MSDPLSPPVMAKILSAAGGFVGGASFMAFLRPKNVWDAAVRSSVSTAAAIIGTIPFLTYMNMRTDGDHIFAAAAFIGFCSWSVLTFIARFLMYIQDERTKFRPPFIERDRRSD